jgi:lipopolysaccharide/colanic/teichoic acid biosynthesis glycosyltransferase
MRHATRSPEQVPLLLFDLIAAIGCYAAATYYVLSESAGTFLLYEGGLNAGVFAAVTLVILLYSRGVYGHRNHRLDLVQDLSLALGGAFILQAVVYYLHRSFALPPRVLLLGTGLFVAQFSVRYMIQRLRSPAFRKERILFVGATPLNRSLAGRIVKFPDFGFAVAGYLDDKLPHGTELEGGAVLGGVKSLGDVQRDLRSDRVVVDVPLDTVVLFNSGGTLPGRLEGPDEMYETLFGRVCSTRLNPSEILFSGGWSGPRAMLALQAVYTNLLALAALLLLSPVMIAVAILIKATSDGAVYETRSMLGWHEATFRLLRFRCHVVRKTPEGECYEETGVGRWLKRLHLHLLPYLINVLRGELAFVGPAPARAEAAAVLMSALPHYRLRYVVKPGITGWSQVKSFPEDDTVIRLENDLYYIKHVSPALDLSIILDAVLNGKGGAQPAR